MFIKIVGCTNLNVYLHLLGEVSRDGYSESFDGVLFWILKFHFFSFSKGHLQGQKFMMKLRRTTRIGIITELVLLSMWMNNMLLTIMITRSDVQNSSSVIYFVDGFPTPDWGDYKIMVQVRSKLSRITQSWIEVTLVIQQMKSLRSSFLLFGCANKDASRVFATLEIWFSWAQ